VYELICIGASWGGFEAIVELLSGLSPAVEQPIVIAQHRSPESVDGALAGLLAAQTSRTVADAEDKLPLESSKVYLAPPDYHLLVERGSLALSLEGHVHFARPSIDVLFESAADAYAEAAVGIILTGANEDGAAGLARIKERGGVAIVQDPEGATRRAMPDAAIAVTDTDAVLPLEEIASFLYGLCAKVTPQ
jgi:two-component system chemotaxis response regulator CheB